MCTHSWPLRILFWAAGVSHCDVIGRAARHNVAFKRRT